MEIRTSAHEFIPQSRCGTCGQPVVVIRGRHPESETRVVCPTCLAERMEAIHQMSCRHQDMALLDTKAVAEPILNERMDENS